MTIADLKRHLDAAVARIRHHPPVIGDAAAMDRAAKALLAAGGKGGDSGSSDRVRHGLQVLAQSGVAAAAPHLRYICWGIAEPFPREPLLRRPEFASVLELVRASVAAGEFTLNPWRGLLQGYLTALPEDIDGPGRSNWLALRDFLAGSLAVMRQRARVTPPWLDILAEHDNLLRDRPCDRYARLLLEGEGARLEPLKEQLGIPERSWFWREAVLAQVRSACDLADAPFRAALDLLLGKLENYPSLANDSLILLLARYARAFADTPHEGLQDYAVKHWGSPDIFAQAKWAQVEPEVKAMVQRWLVRDALTTFFEVLQEDRTADRRRFNFWLRYHGQVSYVRIALGSQPWHSPNPDLKHMREHRHDRVCRLDGGQGSLSAIVMKIGSHFFVEFSHTGNAAYGYAEHQVGFPLDRREMPRDALSNKATASFRESHMDKKTESWEQKFERILADDLGIHPDTDRQPLGPLRARRPTVVARTAGGRPVPKPAGTSGRPLDTERFEALCRLLKLRVEDNRPKGASLWVRHLGEQDAAARELRAMDFHFSPGNGWWRK